MRKLTRTEANFENLLEAALLIEGHCSPAKQRGCCCRKCDECEENYMRKYGEEDNEEPTLAELIDELGDKPNTDVPYGDDPRADDEEYDNIGEDEEGILNVFSQAMEIATKAPDPGWLQRNVPGLATARAKELATAADRIAKGTTVVADRFIKAASKLK